MASDSPCSSTVRVDTIDWYYELRGQAGPTIVLIPSGEGDCESFERVATSLSRDARVLTFDMPGFSRSSDPPNFDRYSIAQAAAEVAALLRALSLPPATIYGCSSGALIALRLASEHSDLVQRAVVHDVPPAMPLPSDPQVSLPALSDDEIADACADVFRNVMNEDGIAWDALGEAFHRRQRRNYVTWVRRYVPMPDVRMPTPAELQHRPVTWTIGGLWEVARMFNNIAAAHAGGIDIGVLMCKHFPQVSIPDALADHIRQAAPS